MDLGLKGKRALITGASTGLGFAVAREYLQEGADVVICARGEDKLQKAVAELSELGEVNGVAADLNTPDGIDHVLPPQALLLRR